MKVGGPAYARNTVRNLVTHIFQGRTVSDGPSAERGVSQTAAAAAFTLDEIFALHEQASERAHRFMQTMTSDELRTARWSSSSSPASWSRGANCSHSSFCTEFIIGRQIALLVRQAGFPSDGPHDFILSFAVSRSGCRVACEQRVAVLTALRPRSAANRLPRTANRPLQLQFLQPRAQIASKVGALQREFHRGLQKSELVSRIVALAFEGVSVDFFLLQQFTQSVRQLQLAARAWLTVCSSASKIPGVRMYRPMMARFDGASSGFGFSTRFEISNSLPAHSLRPVLHRARRRRRSPCLPRSGSRSPKTASPRTHRSSASGRACRNQRRRRPAARRTAHARPVPSPSAPRGPVRALLSGERTRRAPCRKSAARSASSSVLPRSSSMFSSS